MVRDVWGLLLGVALSIALLWVFYRMRRRKKKIPGKKPWLFLLSFAGKFYFL
jgi:LPXTG-motif cell wall-anchored protein